MKKKLMFIAAIGLLSAVAFVKAQATEVPGDQAHYCNFVEETPGRVNTYCTGNALACWNVSDCRSN